MNPTADISVVIPLYNEEKSLRDLAEWIITVCEEADFTVEIIFIDDGSSDNSWNIIKALSEENRRISGIKFRRNYGKSAALNTGFKHARGQVVITMDADLQDSPDEIPELYRMITEEKFDLVSGWKKDRQDPLSKTIPTRLFNFVTRSLSNIHLHDFNCGLKAYRREVVKNIEVYGEMHRYIPVIAKWAGFTEIGEKEVEHQARQYGSSKFGMERFINGFLDLVSIFFMGKFGKRPMHFFGTIGTLSFGLGFLILLYLSISKIFWDETGIAQRPLFYLGILIFLTGTQLFLTGFVAELISRNAPNRNAYHIEAEINTQTTSDSR